MHRHVYTCEHICTSYTYTLHEEWTEGHHTLHNVTTSQRVTQVFFFQLLWKGVLVLFLLLWLKIPRKKQLMNLWGRGVYSGLQFHVTVRHCQEVRVETAHHITSSQKQGERQTHTYLAVGLLALSSISLLLKEFTIPWLGNGTAYAKLGLVISINCIETILHRYPPAM